MTKDPSKDHAAHEPGARPARRSGIDVVRLATLGGVVALLAISLWNWRSISRIQTGLDSRLGQIENRLGQVAGKVDTFAAQVQPPRRGPEPNRAYTINTIGAPVKGPAGAPVTIAEFSDFQWPYCSRVGPTLKRIQEVYGDKVRIVWKDLPLPMHKDAMTAARAAAAAQQQGKFWEFHDKLFANQNSLNATSYMKYARELTLDVDRFGKDMADLNSIAAKRIAADQSEAGSLGITGTPAFFINGRYLSGAQPFEEFAKVIDAELSRLKLPAPKAAQGNWSLVV